MPTKRVKRTPAKVGLSDGAIAAWKVGDWLGVYREFNLLPCDDHPLDVPSHGEPPAWYRQAWQLKSWARAQELRRQLIEVAGRR